MKQRDKEIFIRHSYSVFKSADEQLRKLETDRNDEIFITSQNALNNILNKYEEVLEGCADNNHIKKTVDYEHEMVSKSIRRNSSSQQNIKRYAQKLLDTLEEFSYKYTKNNISNNENRKTNIKSKRKAYILWLISGFGWLGFHRFYLGKKSTGVLWMFTAGIAGLGSIYDLFALGSMVEQYNTSEKLKLLKSKPF